MKLGKKSRQIIKEYIENEVKIARYEAAPLKAIPRARCNRKPTYGPKAP